VPRVEERLSRFGRDEAAVAHDVGLLLHVPATMAVLTLPVALATGEHHTLVPLVVTAVGVGVCGTLLVRGFRHAHAPDRWPAVEVVGLGWLGTLLVASGVLAWLGHAAPDGTADALFRDPWTALFEGTSGITSTGLTMADGAEAELSRTVQWWRSLSQWLGGVGVVLFAAAAPGAADARRALYEAEGRGDDLARDVPGTVRRTWGLYIGLTVAALLVFLAIERDGWTALNHGLTAIATGGFTVTDDSLAGLSAAGRLAAMAVIAAGATTFVVHQQLFVHGDLPAVRRSTPMRAQLVMLAGGALLAIALRWVSGADATALDTAFQWFSASTTAGFTTAPALSAWTTPLLVLLVVGMIIGAPSGSTGGGVKLDRVVWLVASLVARARSRRGVGRLPVRWDGAPVQPHRRRRAVHHAGRMLALWLATLAIGSTVLGVVTDAGIRDVVFEAASAMSNVGLDAEVVDPELSAVAKGTFVALMYLGRLELFAALVLAVQRESDR
jgi:trk system potassium uptake protein